MIQSFIKNSEVKSTINSDQNINKESVFLTGELQINLISSITNNGFAAGNNIGIRYALSKGDADYFWFLNNDTTVNSNTLSLLVNSILKDSLIGIIGCKILLYFNPDTIQCIGGGLFNKYTASIREMYFGKSNSVKIENHPQLDYISGASMMVSSEFIQKVGLMNEEYFLYFEELDWAYREIKCGFQFDYNIDAVVYHKNGATINRNGGKSVLSEYYYARSKILFSKKYQNSVIVFMVYLSLILAIVKRLLKLEITYIPPILKAVFHN